MAHRRVSVMREATQLKWWRAARRINNNKQNYYIRTALHYLRTNIHPLPYKQHEHVFPLTFKLRVTVRSLTTSFVVHLSRIVTDHLWTIKNKQLVKLKDSFLKPWMHISVLFPAPVKKKMHLNSLFMDCCLLLSVPHSCPLPVGSDRRDCHYSLSLSFLIRSRWFMMI